VSSARVVLSLSLLAAGVPAAGGEAGAVFSCESGGFSQGEEAFSPCVNNHYGLSARQEALLDELMRRSFDYFVEQADPATGLVRDRARLDGSAYKGDAGSVASMAATGFGLSALCVGAERGWISRPDAEARAERTLSFLVEKSTEVRGWFYHFVEPSTGERRWNSELSSIDTGLLLSGALTAKGCFSGNEKIASLADRLYGRIDFAWMLDAKRGLLSHGWYPESGFIKTDWDTYSEHLGLALLAIGAPKPVPPSLWENWRRDEVVYGTYSYVSASAPLFVHQYSHAYFDFRGLRDTVPPFTDLFANSISATYAHRQFCVDISSKFPSYSEKMWGISASDFKGGYVAWGGPPLHPATDGTVVPCAAGGSLMFTPEISVPVLMAMKERYPKAWGRYGLVDSFNPADGWYAKDVLGIDLGITLLSAENLRTGNVWKWFMSNPEPRRALELAGLRGGEKTGGK